MTAELGMSQLSAQLGHPYSSGSYDKGSRQGNREPSPITVWRFDSKASNSASVSEHFKDIESRLPPSKVRQLKAANKDIAIWINVAVYFDTAMCTAQLPSECMVIANGYDSGVEITCYPTNFDSSE